MAEYCAAHGYEFARYTHLPDPSRSAAWNKVRVVQQELLSCDWLVWMDADSMPVNKNFSIQKMVEQLPDTDLIISGDEGGLCFGVFAVKNCAWSYQFFQTLWFCGQMHTLYGQRYQAVVKHDQVSVKALVANFPSIASRVFVLPQSFVCNPHSNFERDCFAVHYWATGWSNELHLDRIERKMNYFLDRGWCPAVHRDLIIVTCSNEATKPLLDRSLAQNSSAGYEVCVYDINREIGIGIPFDINHKFQTGPERKGGKLPFKPKLIKRALVDNRRLIAYMDADAFAIRRFDEVNTDDYDVGVTMRRPSERGSTSWPSFYGFINAGVMFFNFTNSAFKFIDLWDAELKNSKANSDQEALNMVVLQATDLTEYNKVFVWNGIRIKVFKCEDYNFYYWPQEPLPTTKIVHCKTDRRDAMDDWGVRDWSKSCDR